MLLSQVLVVCFAVFATASNFGRCTKEKQCGYMCCGPTEECVGNYCIAPSYVVSKIRNHPSLTRSPAKVSSALAEATKGPKELKSLYREFGDVMTDMPLPTPAPVTPPDGFTYPTSLDPSSIAEAASSALAKESSFYATYSDTQVYATDLPAPTPAPPAPKHPKKKKKSKPSTLVTYTPEPKPTEKAAKTALEALESTAPSGSAPAPVVTGAASAGRGTYGAAAAVAAVVAAVAAM